VTDAAGDPPAAVPDEAVPDKAGGPLRRQAPVLAAFASFGLVWGMYAAAMPTIKAATGASDGALGAALSAAGLAALPAMFGIGRLADRYGRRAFLAAAVAFAAAAAVPLFARSVPALVAGLLLFGGCSGAFDVVINHTAVEYEVAARRPVLNKAHAVFSSGLLAGSAGMGALISAGTRPAWVLAVTGAVIGGLALMIWRRLPAGPLHPPAPGGGRRRLPARVWLLGGLGVLALLVESGVQQWSAVLLQDVLHAAPVIAGLGPAVFAGAEALGRASSQQLIERLGDRRLLVCAGLVVIPGAVLLGAAGTTLLALAGVAIAGLGISAASPTLYGLAGRAAAGRDRGRTVAAVSGVAYIGLLGGPGLVGQVADATSLRLALALLAPVALLMVLGIAAVTRRDPGLARAARRPAESAP
jgi:MFS family permease